MENKTLPQKRDIAIKICIKDVKESEYVKDEGNSLNYLLCNGSKVFRVNVIGIVVSKEVGVGFSTLMVDDSTSSIAIRNFDTSSNLDKINIGNIVIIIGRPRLYNNEKYIIPEIIRPLKNKGWLILRKKELSISNISNVQKTENENKKPIEKDIIIEKPKQKEVHEKNPDKNINPYEKILNLVKSLDEGFGVSYEDIIMNSKMDNCEQVIQNLIEEGEIFEVRPGILKVL